MAAAKQSKNHNGRKFSALAVLAVDPYKDSKNRSCQNNPYRLTALQPGSKHQNRAFLSLF